LVAVRPFMPNHAVLKLLLRAGNVDQANRPLARKHLRHAFGQQHDVIRTRHQSGCIAEIRRGKSHLDLGCAQTLQHIVERKAAPLRKTCGNLRVGLHLVHKIGEGMKNPPRQRVCAPHNQRVLINK